LSDRAPSRRPHLWTIATRRAVLALKQNQSSSEGDGEPADSADAVADDNPMPKIILSVAPHLFARIARLAGALGITPGKYLVKLVRLDISQAVEVKARATEP
jgi:hypothetical protein